MNTNSCISGSPSKLKSGLLPTIKANLQSMNAKMNLTQTSLRNSLNLDNEILLSKSEKVTSAVRIKDLSQFREKISESISTIQFYFGAKVEQREPEDSFLKDEDFFWPIESATQSFDTVAAHESSHTPSALSQAQVSKRENYSY